MSEALDKGCCRGALAAVLLCGVPEERCRGKGHPITGCLCCLKLYGWNLLRAACREGREQRPACRHCWEGNPVEDAVAVEDVEHVHVCVDRCGLGRQHGSPQCDAAGKPCLVNGRTWLCSWRVCCDDEGDAHEAGEELDGVLLEEGEDVLEALEDTGLVLICSKGVPEHGEDVHDREVELLREHDADAVEERAPDKPVHVVAGARGGRVQQHPCEDARLHCGDVALVGERLGLEGEQLLDVHRVVRARKQLGALAVPEQKVAVPVAHVLEAPRGKHHLQ